MKKGRKYTEAFEKVDREKLYNVDEAIKLVKDTNITKFDASVDLAINLNIDAKKSDQLLRGSIVLPHGTGVTSKILVVGNETAQEAAKAAGADIVGGVELIEKIQKENFFDFDVIVSTPDMMPELGKIGQLLGPRGLMPNPKVGTVTNNVTEVIEDLKKGMVEFKTDRGGNVHTLVGKISFDNNKLEENLTYFVNNIISLKPSQVRGNLIKTITVSGTMGPGIKINPNNFDK